MIAFLSAHWLDITTTILGLIYIWLEYRASIALWFIGIIMPALDIYLYWQHGLYGDSGMAMYYTAAAIYGYITWKWGAFFVKGKEQGGRNKKELPITHMPLKLYLPAVLFFFCAWGIIYYVLITWTNSTVPVLDSFTNALSFVGLWALARKYIEQWWFWIGVDIVCCILYVQKDIPFKAGLYGLYIIIAILGYFKWQRLMRQSSSQQEITPPTPY